MSSQLEYENDMSLVDGAALKVNKLKTIVVCFLQHQGTPRQ